MSLAEISHLPSKLRFSAKCSFFGQSLSQGHYQPTYQPPEGVYLLNSRSFLANQKARNAIVGAENLLIADSRSFLANQKASNAIVGAEKLLIRFGHENYLESVSLNKCLYNFQSFYLGKFDVYSKITSNKGSSWLYPVRVFIGGKSRTIPTTSEHLRLPYRQKVLLLRVIVPEQHGLWRVTWKFRGLKLSVL